MSFTNQLLHWYHQHKRELPWRNITNPYYIWLSEVILQQTRVEQGLPYYEAFIDNFPELKDLALADEDAVLKLWQGLGYYSRARNLHHTAKTIYFDLNNQFPNQYKEIIKLKGIGPYTAAAIASFAFKEPMGVVDGNVFRVLARFFGIFDDISQAKNRVVFQSLVNELISKKQPDLFNHAIMDFGAMVYTSAQPKCIECPLQNSCYAFQKNEISQLPVKNKKVSVKNRYFHFVLFRSQGKIAIEQRFGKDIWHKLYQFPLIETFTPNEEDAFCRLTATYPGLSLKKLTTNSIRHKLSHQQLHIDFYEIEINSPKSELHFVDITTIEKYAFPIVLWNFIKEYLELKKN
ncbi:MAG TPA: A/G-specific adenine glycosylase [Flavobacterium sp.]|nr:A/G-specific adenine glycosylase [Flavobacterium sp.]